jgi:hypothetical protein
MMADPKDPLMNYIGGSKKQYAPYGLEPLIFIKQKRHLHII